MIFVLLLLLMMMIALVETVGISVVYQLVNT
jgi:hypothetical protein